MCNKLFEPRPDAVDAGAKKPGSTIATLIPNPATSMRSTSDMASRPNFEAWYQPFNGITAALPNIEETMTMRPAPRARIPGNAHELTIAGVTRLTSSCALASAADTSSMAPISEYPALFTTA